MSCGGDVSLAYTLAAAFGEGLDLGGIFSGQTIMSVILGGISIGPAGVGPDWVVNLSSAEVHDISAKG